MKKVLFSLFLAFTCLSAFAQIDASARVTKPIDLVRCTPYTWNITGETYDHDTIVIVTNYHPDTIYVLNLVVDPTNIIQVKDSVSANCVYIWRDSLVWKTAGEHTAIIPDPHGCDSVFTIKLTLTGDHDTAMLGYVETCGKYLTPWGEIFTQDTVIDSTWMDGTCERRDSLILKVYPEYLNLPIAQASENCKYIWKDGNNMVIEDTLVHKYTYHIANDCDSTIRIKVNLSFHIDTTYDVEVCDKWTASWNKDYTATAVVVHSDTNAKGCIYTDTVNLTVNNSFLDTAWAIANVRDTNIGCYLQWGDTLITSVTDPNYVLRLLPNATIHQCDSVAAVRVMTLNNVENVTTTVTPCSHPYKWKPVTTVHSFTSDTLCTDSLIANGCSTYYHLDLHFADSIVNIVRPVRCDYDSIKFGNSLRYSFHINDNGDTIVKRFTGSTSSQTATVTDMDHVYNYVSNKQCSTYYKYTLNIRPIADRSTYDTAVACNKYFYTNFNVYLNYGDNANTTFDTTFFNASSYHYPSASSYPTSAPQDIVNECSKTEYNLHLTLYKSDTLEDNITACDRYTWLNDTTYTYSTTLSRQTNAVNEHNCRTYRTLKLTIKNTPESHISGDWMLLPGGSTTLTATSPVSGLVYTWYLNGVMQPGNAESIDITDDAANGHQNIDVMMTASNGNGCPDSNYVTVTFTNYGIEDAEGIDVTIYPNPASRIVNLRTAEAIGSVSVYNAIGQQVMLREGNGNSMQLDLYGLANGHYTMRIVTTDGRVANRKFIVSK